MHKEETIIIAVYPSAPVEPYFDYCSLLWGNRELKQRRRRQQRRSSKRNRVVEQIDNSASASRFFWTFLCRPCPTATSNFIFFHFKSDVFVAVAVVDTKAPYLLKNACRSIAETSKLAEQHSFKKWTIL